MAELTEDQAALEQMAHLREAVRILESALITCRHQFRYRTGNGWPITDSERWEQWCNERLESARAEVRKAA